MKEEKEFTDILEELAGEELLDEIHEDERFEVVTDDNVNAFVLEYGSRLIKDGMDSINKIKPKITSAQNADEISALSEMIRAMNSTLDTLTKISLQNKKEKVARETKMLAHDTKKQVAGPTTQVIVATREEIFKQIQEATEIEEIKDEQD